MELSSVLLRLHGLQLCLWSNHLTWQKISAKVYSVLRHFSWFKNYKLMSPSCAVHYVLKCMGYHGADWYYLYFINIYIYNIYNIYNIYTYDIYIYIYTYTKYILYYYILLCILYYIIYYICILYIHTYIYLYIYSECDLK